MLRVSLGVAQPLEHEIVASAATAQQVRSYIAARREHNLLADGVISDPAWDILLELFASSLEKRDVMVADACNAVGCPLTTGLGYLRLLQDAGLVHRKDQRRDMRTRIITITDEGRDLVHTFLTRL